MWIAVRIIAAVLGFFARYVHRMFPPKPAGKHAGQPYFSKVEKTKGGEVSSFRIGMGLRVPVLLRLQREGGSDQFFKQLGLATEYQTGDESFDREIYIACDHPALHQLLKDREGVREKIREVLDAGFRRISMDGEILWIERNADREPCERELTMLSELRSALGDVRSSLRYFSDPFHARVVAVEALTWSLFAYAIAAILDFRVAGGGVHVDPARLVFPGIIAGVLLGALLFWLVASFLKGSSRGHRVLVESAVLILLSLPVAGIQLVADVNRGFDRSPPAVVTRDVVDKDISTGYRRSKRYYLFLGPMDRPGIELPTLIQVSPDVYYQAEVGRPVDLHVGRGLLGYPWYRKVEAKGA